MQEVSAYIEGWGGGVQWLKLPAWKVALGFKFQRTKMLFPRSLVKIQYCGEPRVACSASDHQGPNFESCVCRAVSSHSSHHPQEVLLGQFNIYVHKGGLKPHSFHFIYAYTHCVICLYRPNVTHW